jgi:hypothetical protein
VALNARILLYRRLGEDHTVRSIWDGPRNGALLVRKSCATWRLPVSPEKLAPPVFDQE